MKEALQQNRLPIIVSVAALLVATMIGLVPVVQQNRTASSTSDVDLSEIEARLDALESVSAGAPADAPELPPNAGNARLRQEIDLLTKGLGNQTGRVSRLSQSVEGLIGSDGAPLTPPRVEAELALAKRGLANLTRRINALDKRLDALDTAAADIARLQKQMANVDKAFLRVSRTLRAIKSASATAPSGTSGLPEAEKIMLEDIQGKLGAILRVLDQ